VEFGLNRTSPSESDQVNQGVVREAGVAVTPARVVRLWHTLHSAGASWQSIYRPQHNTVNHAMHAYIDHLRRAVPPVPLVTNKRLVTVSEQRCHHTSVPNSANCWPTSDILSLADWWLQISSFVNHGAKLIYILICAVRLAWLYCCPRRDLPWEINRWCMPYFSTLSEYNWSACDTSLNQSRI